MGIIFFDVSQEMMYNMRRKRGIIMFLNKKKNANEPNLKGYVEAFNMQAFYKAILYNYDNTTNARKYLNDIKKYNLRDEEIESIYKNDKTMEKHPIVKEDYLINELCKSYGFDEFYYGVKTLKEMMDNELFEFEIKGCLNNQIRFYEEIEKLSSGYIRINPKKRRLVEVNHIEKSNDLFTDGEILSVETENDNKKIIISNPTFTIKTKEEDIYRRKDQITIYGFCPNVDKLPSFKEINSEKKHIK